MLGGTASAGMELGERKGDLARSCGLPGTGVLNPVGNFDPLPFPCEKMTAVNNINQ